VNGALILIRGEGVVEEKLLGPVTSILASTLDYRGKVLVASATSGESELKISSRVGDAFEGSANLGLIMRGAAEAVGGTGGGHAMAAGAKIPSSAADSFFKLVTKEICR
jgi:RecJ-like exonuclease